MTKSARGPRGTIGTVAYYGPDNTRATKLVASIAHHKRGGGIVASETWISDASDLRHDSSVAAQVLAFFARHRVTDIAKADRIIGCPHQEGIDYPMGRTCPTCPFWKNLDRFTHEPLPTPVATMSPAEVLEALSSDLTVQPFDALESADAHRMALLEPLLAAIDRAVSNPLGISEEDAGLFSYAIYLMAKWRETRASPYIIRWLSLSREQSDELSGDMVTEDGFRILAAVFDGDLEPIKQLILNQAADEYGRSAGVGALAALAAWAEAPRQTIVDCLGFLLRGGLEREPSHVWNSLCRYVVEIEVIELFPELRRAFDEGLIEEQFIGKDEVDEAEAAPRGALLEDFRDRCPPIDDVAEATSWWAPFHEGRDHGEEDLDEDDDPDLDIEEPAEPYVAPPKVGRNEPCPCGSGKKYKKCHGQ